MEPMTWNEAKENIRSNISCIDYLERSTKGGTDMYCCPECNSGQGHNKTGAVKYYKETNKWYCHACGAHGDVIDLYMKLHNTDFAGAVNELANAWGIPIEKYKPPTAAEAFNSTPGKATERPQSDFTPTGGESIDKQEQSPQAATGEARGASKNFTGYYRECNKRLSDPAAVAYLESRGISFETANNYFVGYDPGADPAESGHKTPRLILPTTTSHYVARSIDPATPKQYAKMNPKNAPIGIFNLKSLYTDGLQEVFITEGVFDALSIIEAGGIALALNSTSNADLLIKRLKEKPTNATLIICLDNDEAGSRKAAELRQALTQLNINNATADICNGYKDPNEALTADKDAFIKAVEKAKIINSRPDNIDQYLENGFLLDVAKFKSDKKTGYANLDKQAGGLYAGLYVLAAISSLGKTSFALSIADNIAASGHDVLFFSLEQSRLEMVSKSIARTAATHYADQDQDITALSIRKHGFSKNDTVKKAAAKYRETVKDHLSIIEGNFNCDISFIGDYVRQYMRRNDTRPVVFIDYLQILQPGEQDHRIPTKETIDTAVTELKRLSRELELTIFVISSVNRANYLTPIDFESLKESGGIEFTADVIFGLQLQCLEEDLFATSKDTKIGVKRERIKRAKREMPRKIMLVCLKNRYGIANYNCYYLYYPNKDLFVEQTEAQIIFDKDPDKNPFTPDPNRKIL